MPKKHQPNYASIKPKSTNPPTLQSSRNTSSTPSPQTVNDRIQQLRREQAPRATAQRRDEITEVVSHRTVPPHLRRILHMAEVDAPKPKPGVRRTTQGRRLPPGPAAPSSWLGGSRTVPENMKKSKAHQDYGTGIGRFCKLTRAFDEEFEVRNDTGREEDAFRHRSFLMMPEHGGRHYIFFSVIQTSSGSKTHL